MACAPCSIRDGEPADRDALLALNRHDERFLSPLSASGLQALQEAGAWQRIAQCDGRVAGFLIALREGASYGSPNYRWFAARYPRFFYIDRVVVAEEFRGRGIGSALYADAIERARSLGLGIVACEFDLHPPNPASERFHARRGFEEVGRQELAARGKTVSLQRLRLAPPG